MPNKKNLEKVEKLKEKIKNAKSVVFAEYKGLTANQANELRKKLGDDSELEIAKNTLLKVSLKDLGHDISEVEKSFEGTTAALFAYSDPINPIKKLFEFIKTAALPIVKLGLMEGRFLTGAEVETLSKLPSREQLIARVLSGLNSPLTGFVNALTVTKRNFVNVLSKARTSL
ncbi:50S ribosomal protein L10 [candidate division WWE3 bacterium]|nr:50S ribosomal protein L10 [candidate division WWE3 bacterium]